MKSDNLTNILLEIVKPVKPCQKYNQEECDCKSCPVLLILTQDEERYRENTSWNELDTASDNREANQ